MYFFFFNDTATTEIYTLSLHDALPISGDEGRRSVSVLGAARRGLPEQGPLQLPEAVAYLPDRHLADRKSTRLNSSHANISYAVFCLKKKKQSRLHGVSSYFISTLK